MGGWREKNYWKVVSVAYFVDSGIMIYAMHKYHIGSVWQAQFATWLLALAGVLAIAERLYWKKIPEGERRERIARLKDVYYDKTICIIYVIVWLILLFGEFQSGIGQYYLIDITTWGSLAMAIMLSGGTNNICNNDEKKD